MRCKRWWSDTMGSSKVHTYDIVKAPPDANVVPCRWVFCRKHNGEGEVVHPKARLVAKGFKQQFRVDYHETFAPTVLPATLCLLLAIAAQKGSVVVQANAKNAYLHGTLEPNKIIYMDLPPKYSLFNQIPANCYNFLSLFHFSHYCSITTFPFSLNFDLHSLTVHTQPHLQSCCLHIASCTALCTAIFLSI